MPCFFRNDKQLKGSKRTSSDMFVNEGHGEVVEKEESRSSNDMVHYEVMHDASDVSKGRKLSSPNS